MRIFNVGIALFLLGVAWAVYWYAYRPLPQVRGALQLPVSGTATVMRDARGVPHIEASTWQDAIFLQGYVTAQDRLWQMDTLRRFGAGELAEVFGAPALAADVESRRMRMRAIAEGQAAALRPQDRAVLTEYARGVSCYIATHRGDYSLEFSLTGHAYDPRPWTVTDSLLVGLVMFRDLTDSWKSAVEKGAFLTGSENPSRARMLFPAKQGGSVSPGSNAWAVSGAHTADGKPMVANDPHLSYGMPATWHLVHLKAPGLNVSGAALPGVPCVITGHNEQIAWGVTNTEVDAADLYFENLNARTGQYVFKNSVEQAQLDREVISVRGAKPVEVNVWVTRHGPVLIERGGRSITIRWTAAGGFTMPFLDLDRAKNWGEFRAALQDFWGPGQNFVYADRAGNIGYQATGKVPIRQGFDSDVPLDGTSGEAEWAGFIPFEQMPSIYNPASGVIATANQNPFPTSYAYRVDGSFADTYRILQIRSLLGAKQKLTVNDMLAMQKDVYAAYNHFLARQAIAAAQHKGDGDALLREAVDLLRRWNGQMDKDEAAPMVTELLHVQLGHALVAGLLPPAARKVQLAILPRPAVIERLLRARPSGWVEKNDWDGWVLKNLTAALQAGRATQGSPVARWKWGQLLSWKLEHPVGKELPLVNGYFDIGPVEMSGSGTTVKQTTATLGPSERMVADVGDWENSVQNLTVGESGHVASPHYKDQWAAYYVGTSFPMEFQRVEAKEVLRIVPGR